MADPRRLLAGATDDERVLLSSARGDDPPAGARDRTLSMLGLVGVSAGAAAGTGLVASTRWGLGSTTKVALALLGLIAVGGAWVVSRRNEARDVGRSLVDVAPRPAPALPPPAISEAPSPSPVPLPSVAPAVVATSPTLARSIPSTMAAMATMATTTTTTTTTSNAPSVAAPTTSASPSATASPSSGGFDEELALVVQARDALRDGRAADALATLDAHDRAFPSGLLAQESTVLRVEALVLSGDRPHARALADAFMAAHADSPYASRLLRVLGANP